MPKLLAPIVGSHFRPPAVLILKHLPTGQDLILTPEPDNYYDKDAVKVLIHPSNIPELDELKEGLLGYGWTWDLLQCLSEVELGYLPTSGGRFARIDGVSCPGNREFLNVMQGPEWTSKLSFSPGGMPLVEVEYDR